MTKWPKDHSDKEDTVVSVLAASEAACGADGNEGQEPSYSEECITGRNETGLRKDYLKQDQTHPHPG